MRCKRVPNIVPPLVLSATFVGVVPACALVSCGSSPTDRDQDVLFGGDVAAMFDHKDVHQPIDAVTTCCFGVADATFDVIDEPTDAADDADDAAESGRDG